MSAALLMLSGIGVSAAGAATLIEPLPSTTAEPLPSASPPAEPLPSSSPTAEPGGGMTPAPSPEPSESAEPTEPVPGETVEPSPEPSSSGTPEESAAPMNQLLRAAPESSATASGLAGFRPGNIISDEVFGYAGSMTQSQIDAFLREKGTSCSSGGGRTCLKDYRATTYSFPGDQFCSGYQSSGSETAAAMIYKSAIACGVNPQVLLVTLQKEQSLITAAMSSTTYARAMGFGCPDNAGGQCDPNYAGFHVQVYYAARQYVRYAELDYFDWYPVGRTSNIRWHPNASCGSSPVVIENQATANLYYYTPYQPNAAALRAGWGTGDSCSAYGNRNFFNYFTSWFGSTQSTSGDPWGQLESVTPSPGGARVTGWVRDPNTSGPVTVRIKSGVEQVARVAADQQHGSAGGRYGFDVEVPLSAVGSQQICVAANNVGAGANRTIGCQQFTHSNGRPFGYVNEIRAVPGGVHVKGWVIDPDTRAALTVRVVSDGGLVTRLTAERTRNDVGSRYPAYGAAHGFEATIPLTAGRQQICIAANNVGRGANSTIGCAVIAPVTGSPIGYVNEMVAVSGGVRIKGWALDPDSQASVGIRVKSGSALAGRITADGFRADVARNYPLHGGNRAFETVVPLLAGKHEICVVANNIGSGGHRTLRCATLNVPR